MPMTQTYGERDTLYRRFAQGHGRSGDQGFVRQTPCHFADERPVARPVRPARLPWTDEVPGSSPLLALRVAFRLHTGDEVLVATLLIRVDGDGPRRILLGACLLANDVLTRAST